MLAVIAAVVGVVLLLVVVAGVSILRQLRHSADSADDRTGPGISAATVPSGPEAVRALTADIDADLNSGFLSPGHAYGGPFTQGTLVGQVEAHGAVMLSMHSTDPADGLSVNTFDVLLGVTDADTTPQCYRFSFTVTNGSAVAGSVPCPGGTTATLRLARTLLPIGAPPTGSNSGPVRPGAYPVTAAGVHALLRDEYGADAGKAPLATATTTGPDGTPVLTAAVRVHGVCTLVRLGTSQTVTSWVAAWQAPIADQSACAAPQAATAAPLYGTDAAAEG